MSEIDPALSPKEWERLSCIRGPNVLHARDGANVGNGHGCLDVGAVLDEPREAEDYTFPVESESVFVEPASRHALAALCLHGQPFGFTWEDVDALRSAALEWQTSSRPNGDGQLQSIADRIASLLPPREP